MPARTLDEQIAEVRRELGLRARVYPAFIERGRLTSEDAVTQVERLEAVLDTLEWLARHRAAIVALGREAMAIKAAPAIAAAIDTFPGAAITGVRPIDDARDTT